MTCRQIKPNLSGVRLNGVVPPKKLSATNCFYSPTSEIHTPWQINPPRHIVERVIVSKVCRQRYIASKRAAKQQLVIFQNASFPVRQNSNPRSALQNQRQAFKR
ncbi:hypothetical protein [Candidatus Spongiihabitans sp.]|uniref:hypothetical protein n=1 Tax=Candidatus Spongiihabitans sp. TaxID=3101308 RepID=UPI003C6F79CF